MRVQRVALFAVVAHAGQGMHLAVQAAAQSHVDFLQAATNAQQRHAGIQRGAHQRQRGGVALGVVEIAFTAGFAVVVRLDVRRAAGEAG